MLLIEFDEARHAAVFDVNGNHARLIEELQWGAKALNNRHPGSFAARASKGYVRNGLVMFDVSLCLSSERDSRWAIQKLSLIHI